MITHNMKDAIAHGNRLIMMDAGHIVVDISGEEKKKLTVPDLLALFSHCLLYTSGAPRPSAAPKAARGA